MRWLTLLLLALLLSGCGTPAAVLPTSTPPPLGEGVLLLSASLDDPRESWLFNFPVFGGEFSAISLPGQALPYIASWSPDGQSMAVVLLNPASEVDIYLYLAADRTLEKLTDTPQCTEVGLAWSPDSQVLRFAALCREENSPTEIFEMTLSSREVRSLGIIPLQALYVTWNAGLDLLALAYPQSLDSGERKVTIYIEGGAGLGSSDVTAPVSAVTDAASGASGLLSTIMDWSPDGQQLAYVSRMTEGVTYLLRLPARGGEASVIRAMPGECLFPRWSPDASQVSLVCGTNLYLVSADGSRQTLLVEPPPGWFVAFPSWGADGQTVAFLSAPVDNPAARRLDVISLTSQSYTTLGEVLGAWQAGIFWKPTGTTFTAFQPTPAATDILSPARVPPAMLWGWGILLLVLAVAVTARRLRLSGFDLLGGLTRRRSSGALRRGSSAVQTQVMEPEPAPASWEEEEEEEDDLLAPQPVVAIETPAAPPPSVPPQPVPLPPPSADPQLLSNGINLVRSGAYEHGIKILRQYIAAEERNPTAWLWLGNACAQRGDYRTAQRCFVRAEKLGSPSARPALAWLETKKREG